MNDIFFKSDSSHWMSPPDFMQVLRPLGPIRLDPCSHPLARTNARTRWSLVESAASSDLVICDGLETSWEVAGEGYTYVNPPYGRELAFWASKMRQEADRGVEIVALVPARVDTQWWRTLRIEWWCAITGRLSFLEPVEIAQARYEKNFKKKNPLLTPPPFEFEEELPGLVRTDPAPFPSAVLYLGKRWGLFSDALRSIGQIYRSA